MVLRAFAESQTPWPRSNEALCLQRPAGQSTFSAALGTLLTWFCHMVTSLAKCQSGCWLKIAPLLLVLFESPAVAENF